LYCKGVVWLLAKAMACNVDANFLKVGVGIIAL
jgi:hypothetical protein